MNKFTFTPLAYRKLAFFLLKGHTEICGFGVTDKDDPSLIIDFQLVEAECSSVTAEMTEDGIQDHMFWMAQNGIQPSEGFRVWIHTHPGNSATPSKTDWDTLEELMEDHDYMVMLIMARDTSTTCHVHAMGGKLEAKCGVGIDWKHDSLFDEINKDFLEEEYKNKVKKKTYTTPVKTNWYHTHNGGTARSGVVSNQTHNSHHYGEQYEWASSYHGAKSKKKWTRTIIGMDNQDTEALTDAEAELVESYLEDNGMT